MKYKFLLILLVLSIGCATAPSRRYSSYYKEIEGRGHISLNEFARKYDFQIDFDPFLKKVYLTKGDSIELIFALESSVALLNNQVLRLEGSLRVEKGDLRLSSQSARMIINQIYYDKKPQEKKQKKISDIYRVHTIVLDPGHGGKDPGAIGASGVYEKDLVLSIAKILKSKLERAGYKVKMTRNDDSYISLWNRVAFANREGADLFLSIHANSARAKSASGFEVFYLSEASDESARSLAAAENYPLGFEESLSKDLNVQAAIWDLLYTENRKDAIRLGRKICLAVDSLVSIKNRGLKSANFYVLRGAQMPAVLIEVGFISNKHEESNLKTWRFKNKVAEALVRGVESYEKEYLVSYGYNR
ncbi:MAG: N-acetylmuramoyl-L-alanine amidase [Candidatus Kaelpia imicola]|nr:N-acetylmuramoyl-L-alanine amidase [Candidatus Kaelpia imicola]